MHRVLLHVAYYLDCTVISGLTILLFYRTLRAVTLIVVVLYNCITSGHLGTRCNTVSQQMPGPLCLLGVALSDDLIEIAALVQLSLVLALARACGLTLRLCLAL